MEDEREDNSDATEEEADAAPVPVMDVTPDSMEEAAEVAPDAMEEAREPGAPVAVLRAPPISEVRLSIAPWDCMG
jgi:hypothetical protein